MEGGWGAPDPGRGSRMRPSNYSRMDNRSYDFEDVVTRIQSLVTATSRLKHLRDQISQGTDVWDEVRRISDEGKRLAGGLNQTLRHNPGSDSASRNKHDRLCRDFKDALHNFEVQLKMTSHISRRSSVEATTTQTQPKSSSNSRLFQSKQEETVSMELEQVVVDRNVAMKQVEKDVTELNQLFQDVAVLVDQQQEHMDLIEVAVAHAKDDVVLGTDQLVQAHEYKKRTRKRKVVCCCCLFTLLAIGVIILLYYLGVFSGGSPSPAPPTSPPATPAPTGAPAPTPSPRS